MPDTSSAAPGRERSRYRQVITWLTAVCVVGIDAATKVAATHEIAHRQVRVLWGLIVFELTRNAGAAFSFGRHYTAFIALIALGTAIGIIYAARTSSRTMLSVALGLILGGALGNLADRIMRAPGAFDGHVVDWIHIAFLPFVFNLADTAITFGAVLLAICLFAGSEA